MTVAISSVLDNNSWSTIHNASANGTAKNYWSVGDCKKITISGTIGTVYYSNISVYAFIIGIGHNATYEGSRKIHFQIGKKTKTSDKFIVFHDPDGTSYTNDKNSFCMNPASYWANSTNRGGWKSCTMRSTIMSQFLSALSSDVKNVILCCTKYTDNVGGSPREDYNYKDSVKENVTATSDKLFLISEFELWGSINYANTYEATYQKQYDYYIAGNSKASDPWTSSYRVDYWGRSPSMFNQGSVYANEKNFLVFDGSSGKRTSARNLVASGASNGIAPIFCV